MIEISNKHFSDILRLLKYLSEIPPTGKADYNAKRVAGLLLKKLTRKSTTNVL